MKPVDVKSNTYINSGEEINNKDPEFKTGDLVRISKYRNIFAKCYQVGLKTFLRLKKLKIMCCGHMSLVILKVKKLLVYFTKKNCIK